MDLDATKRKAEHGLSARLSKRLRSMPGMVGVGTAPPPPAPLPVPLPAQDDDALLDGVDDAALDALFEQSETHAALEHLREVYVRGPASRGALSCVPLVLESQLYTVVRNRSLADRQVAILHRDRTILKFHVPSSVHFALVFFDDYAAMLRTLPPPASTDPTAFRHLLERLEQLQKDPQTDVAIAEPLLREKLAASDADVVCVTFLAFGHFSLPPFLLVSCLLRSGLVVRGDAPRTVRFSLPGMGTFLRHYRNGNAEVIRQVRLSRHQEIMERVRPRR